MAAIPVTSFDLGPLTWVKTEIDHSLNQARENLDKLTANPADRAPVKYILTHLHQATGALAMVGLGAATRFNEELEKLVAYLEGEDAGRIGGTVGVAKKGISALSSYLDSLLAGDPDRPMTLLAAYLELNRARGGADANEGDLFYPNLSLELPPVEPAQAVLDDAVLAKALSHQRSQYQQGLLKVLKGGDISDALRQMHGAVVAIESLQATTNTRPFWTAAAAFFDALVFGGLEPGASAKPLYAKVDQQIKQMIEGSAKVPERLFRDLLLSVGRARPVTDRVALAHDAYHLPQLMTTPEAPHGDSGDEELAGLLREMRDLTAQQKDTWLKYTSGNRAALEPFGKQSLALAEKAQRLPNRDIQLVLVRLTDVAPTLKAKAIPPSEAQALEVATAMLFIEASLENYFKLGTDFARQSKTVTERLRIAMAGDVLPPMDALEGGLLDEMTRRAQERLLIFQVGQEVQVNLQNIEQALDAFFRDAAKRPELKGLPGLFAQVQGALMIMELHDAAGLNAAVMARVQQFAEGSADGVGEAAEMVADGLSALGLYINALQQGAANPREVLMPALIRYGLAEAPAKKADTVIRRTATVSPGDLDVQKQKVAALYEDWQEAPKAEKEETKERLEQAVGDLKRDAAVMSESTLAIKADAVLAAIQGSEGAQQTGVFQAIQGVAPDKAPADPTPQMVQLVDAPGAEIDKELLEIFLEEASEVVATIYGNLMVCRDVPHDREALTTIRRGFHTLKGSGRMVGLTDLGEVAWQCEQVLNKWLKEERPATPGLLSFIDLAQDSFGGWIGVLKSGAPSNIDGSELAHRAEQLKSGEEPESAPAVFESLPEVEPASTATAEAAAAPSFEEPAPVAAEAPAPAESVPALDFASLDLTPAPSAADAAPPAVEITKEEALAFSFDDILAPAAEAPPAATEPAEEERIEETTEESDVVIGSIVLSPAFFAIYIGECEEHIATLEREMSAIEADPVTPVSHDFMRAAHTLTSSSRTTSFDLIADVASALEKWLSDAIDFPPEFDAHRLAATRRAVDALTAMVHSVRGRAEPFPRDDVIVELTALREGLKESRKTGEGTHIKMPGVVREALEARQEALASAEPPAEPVEEPIALFEEPVAEPPAPEPVVEAAPPEPVFEAPAETFQPPAPVEAPPTQVETKPFSFEPPAPEPEKPVVVPPPGPIEHARAAAAEAPAAAPAPVAEPAEAQFEAGKDQRKIKDDVDLDLLPIFLDEAKEIIPLVSESVRHWKGAPSDHAPVADLHRHLHTLKGSARMAGLMRLGELAHVLETRVITMEGDPSPTVRQFDELEERVDRFSVALERLARGEDLEGIEPVEVPVSAVFEQQRDKPGAIAVMAAAAQEVREQAALPPELREARVALLRVNAEMIDRFVNEAGELSIARSRIEGEMTAFKRALIDLTDNVSRMRAQLREIEIASETQMQSAIKLKEEHGEHFDPLELDRFSRMQELTRFLAESLGDVITLQQSLQKNLDETELAIHQQARLNRELQQGLMGVRLVPLANLQDRFYRVVRQTAKELNKKANLELKGSRVELDRSVLEKITGPFEHLLRNAVGHGLEMPEERVKRGKPEIGELLIDAAQRGNEVVLTVSDDGAGLNYKRIREKAIEAGLLAPDVDLPDSQLAQFIFMAGFSTASEVTQIAGRGVGMDVVRNEITSLGGRVEISSTPGRGTAFTISLPLTLAVTQAVMLRAGTTIYAVPSVMIEQVQEYKAAPYAEVIGAGEVRWKDNTYALRSLLPLLGEIDTPTPARQIPVLLLKSGVQRAAIRVDEIIGNREVVVKTIGPQLSRLAGIAGATVLGNGQVVLILNPVQLVHREMAAGTISVVAAPAQEALVVDQRSGSALVMVVDDSLTVRKITGRMLAREGYEFITAKDGVDALQQLQDVKPDCILLDVEMPRMDGFEFARNVRADAETKHIPIIMITSRTADKHRNHALEIGVNEYMGKPYQEDQLLALIKRYTEESAFA
ncbi:Sensor histidine kinase RcsC [Usitatibacter rugosus]|uniref:Chemotaxis protein CheA n=1 Tax=Usitatibacter rugosus TaxID=2732067 RepID=A0A6M4GNV6_9PROT|nr:Hpt domain-containing protein [Usitatibacter rugosus]QJR09009.1 Sensor histidine kinase RcsC [Usitatibacter rugosus]